MIAIIAGTRSFSDRDGVFRCIDRAFPDPSVVTEVVSGGASGVDLLGEKWAKKHLIPVRRFPAYWNFHGAMAGPIRNVDMARYACGWKETEDYAVSKVPGALVLIWDKSSRGSAHMLRTAKRYALIIHEFSYQDYMPST